MAYRRGIKSSAYFVEKIGTTQISGGGATFQELWVTGNVTAQAGLAVTGLASLTSIQNKVSTVTIASSVAGFYGTMGASDYMLLINSNAVTGACTFRLTHAQVIVPGRTFVFKDIGGMCGTVTSNITIAAALTTETIDGQTAVTMKMKDLAETNPGRLGYISVVSDGASWFTF